MAGSEFDLALYDRATLQRVCALGAPAAHAGRINEIGYMSITAPGTLMALAQALVAWGTRPLADLIRQAAAHAEQRVHVWHYGGAAPNAMATRSGSGRRASLSGGCGGGHDESGR